MGRISLQKNNKNAGKRAVGLENILAGLTAFVIMGTGLIMSGCGFQRVAEAAATDTPVATQTVNPTATPTLKPTEAPTPTPSPTPKTVPDLTDEEVAREMESLGIIDFDAEIPLNQVVFVLYSRINEKGEKSYFFEFTKLYRRANINREILSRLWDDSYIFEFDKTYDYLELAPQEVAIVPLFESLKDVKVEFISILPNLDYICNEYGIPFKNVSIPLTKDFQAFSDCTKQQEGSFTYREYAEYYIRSLLKENRVTKADFVGPIEYVAPTVSPELSPTPTATVAPTAFRDGNASVRYLTGDIDLDTEMENKTKRM